MAKDYLKDLMNKAKKKKQAEGQKTAEETGKKEVVEEKARVDVEAPKTNEIPEKPAEEKHVEESVKEKPKEESKDDQDIDRVLKELEKNKTAAGSTDLEEEEEAPKESEVERETRKAKGEKTVLEKHGQAELYTIEGQQLSYYYLPVPKPTAAEKSIISTIKEAATRLISITKYRVRDPGQRRSIYKQRILEILKSSPELKIPKGRYVFYAEAVIKEMIGYGIIDELVSDDDLEEIMVIGQRKPVYVFHRKHGMMKTNIEFFSNSEITDLINRIAREIGRRVDFSAPLLDARLPDGSRVHAAINPAAVSGSTLTIRKFKKDPYSLVDLIKFKTMSVEAAAFLWLMAEGLQAKPANMVISGGTGSGKTTTLNVLCSLIPDTERVISIEDTAELNLPLKHWVRMEGRPPSLEGKGEITLDILTKNALRMRPDRIIVGEIRHDEAFTLFTAMNTGHAGSMGTVHANSAKETLIRVTSKPMNVPTPMLSGLDFVIVQQRIHDKKLGPIRRVTEIAEISGALEGKPETQTLFEWNPKTDELERTSMPSVFLKGLADLSSLSQKEVMDELKDRQEVLANLHKKEVRVMEDVTNTLRDFIVDRRRN